MAEILYHYNGKHIKQDDTDVRWLSRNDLEIFNHHLLICGQKTLARDVWNQIYDDGTIYCMLFLDEMPVARACVEKYSETMWEIADVRVAKDRRNKGCAFKVCSFVLNYILEQDRTVTIRTEEDNYYMQRVIKKLGFVSQNIAFIKH